jgi:hypothetical protein
MRILKKGHKNLFILEAIYILSLRNNVEYNDKYIDEVWMDESISFDNMCNDLRLFRRNSHELKYISENEYESCCDYFGFDEK